MADTTSQTVKVYVGVWGAQGKLEATLSDSSASAYVDTSVTDPGGSSDGIARVYTLTYRAASSGQTLTVKWTVETMHEAQWGNVTLQAATLVTHSNSGTVYQDLQYAYTANGNLSTIADHTVADGAGDQAMTYDSLDRLTDAEGPYGTGGATASITYSYDELGNLTANSQVGSYTYPTSGSSSVRPHAVSTAGSNSYSYDGNGNMTAGADRSFTYNLENKPLTITIGGQTTTFVYDGDNGRVKKVVGSATTRYISQLYECENASCSRMIFAGSERVATLAPSGGVQYYHPDHLGSSSVITDGTGATVQALTYFPYGATRTNSSPVTPAVDVPYKYTGQELDASTGLYDYAARQYEAALGRFVSPDTVVSDPFNPQDLNRYAYVRNNPINYLDPTGNSSIGPEDDCKKGGGAGCKPPDNIQDGEGERRRSIREQSDGTVHIGFRIFIPPPPLFLPPVAVFSDGEPQRSVAIRRGGVDKSGFGDKSPEIQFQEDLIEHIRSGRLITALFFSLGINSAGGLGAGATVRITFPDKKQLAEMLKISPDKVHAAKRDIIGAAKAEVKRLGVTNPNIGIDATGKIVLADPRNSRRTIGTELMLDWFRR